MKILSYFVVAILFISCKDQIIEPETNYVTTPSICPIGDPEAEPSRIRFNGIESVTNITKTGADVSWKHIDGLYAYHIINITPVDRKVLTSVNAPNNSIHLKGLQPDTQYKLMVRAMDTNGYIDVNTQFIEFRTKPWPNFNNQKSLTFNGSQSIQMGPSNFLNTLDSFTISTWFKKDNATKSEQRLLTLHKENQASSALSIGFKKYDLELVFFDDTNNYFQAITIENDYSDGKWHQLALTIDNRKISLYIDGKMVHQSNDSVSKFGSHQFHIGSYTGIQKGFIGKIDEFAIFNKTLNLDELKDLYYNGKSSDLRSQDFAYSLIHWWQFGDQARDNSSNIEDVVGTKNGTPFNITNNDFSNDSP